MIVLSYPRWLAALKWVLASILLSFPLLAQGNPEAVAVEPVVHEALPAQPASAELPVNVAPGQINPAPVAVDKRVFGVLPNYRTADSANPFVPLTTKGKFTIATKDSFDYPVLFTTMFFASLSQMSGSDNQYFGQGVKGLAHRTGISYVDQVVGNYFPEAIVPSLFHLDPRYYRKGTGSGKSRFVYAITRIFVCKSDSGNWTFNANEFVGNSLAAIAASSYHPHERTPYNMAIQASNYIESDVAGQLLKEFWPDVKRWYHRRHEHSVATSD